MNPNRKTILVSIPLLLLTAASLVATPRDMTITLPADAPIACLVQVASPQAHCAAISDALGLVAIGNRTIAGRAGEVSIFGLDAQGKIVGQPAPPTPKSAPLKPLFTISLPRPASLSVFGNAAVSMTFHPKLPLLYIWQDTTGPVFASAKSNVVMNEFDHLLIYRISPGAAPQLVQAVGRGPEYFYGQSAGSIVIDTAGARIYLPNLRQPDSADNASLGAVGFMKLDAQGLPLRVGDKPDLTIDGVGPFNAYPLGLGFVPVSDDVTITTAMEGPATCDRATRRGRWCGFQLTPLSYTSYRMVGHPTLPVVFLSMINSTFLFRMEHTDGYLTLLPQTLNISAPIYSSPVVMAKQKKIAVGGAGRVHVIGLDDDGRLTPRMEQMTVGNPTVETLVYSEKFDRLYVPVEQMP